MGYIYKITNDINNKQYIGLTFKEDPFERWKKHLSDYKYMTQYSNRPLYVAMQKYGVQHFHFTIIDQQKDNNKLKEKQQYYIKLFNTYNQGYNATLGGDGNKKEIQQQEKKQIVNLYQQGYSIKQLSQKFHHKDSTISYILQELNCSINKNNQPKKVLQIDKETGEILNSFNSFLEAAKFLNKTGKGSHISEVCKGKRKSAYGFFWKTI